MRFDWNKLKILYTVAHEGSLTAAGQRLNLCQSAVSRQIAMLEYELKCKLFNRKRDGVKLTEEGYYWYEKASNIFKELEYNKEKSIYPQKRKILSNTIQNMIEDIARELNSETDQPSNIYSSVKIYKRKGSTMQKIQILTTDILAKHVVLPSISKVFLNDSNFHFTLKEASMDRKGEENTDIFFLSLKHEAPGFIQEIVKKTKLSLYASQSYIDRFGVPKTYADCKNHKFIRPGRADILKEKAPKDFPVYGENSIVADSLTAVFSLGEMGMGIIATTDDIATLSKTGMKKIDDIVEPFNTDISLGINEKIKDVPAINNLCEEMHSMLNY